MYLRPTHEGRFKARAHIEGMAKDIANNSQLVHQWQAIWALSPDYQPGMDRAFETCRSAFWELEVLLESLAEMLPTGRVDGPIKSMDEVN